MKLKDLSELAWKLYQNGRTSAVDQKATKPDIAEKCKLSFAALIRQMWYESIASDEYKRPDYSFTSPLLEVKRFDVKELTHGKFMRCDMSEYDMFRMPGNSHIPNVYPVGDCSKDNIGRITQVNPSEENFYVDDPDMADFMFFVIKGEGINIYNLPACVKNVDVEATYDAKDNTVIDKGMASKIIDDVLGVILGIKKQYYYEEAQKAIQEQNVVK